MFFVQITVRIAARHKMDRFRYFCIIISVRVQPILYPHDKIIVMVRTGGPSQDRRLCSPCVVNENIFIGYSCSLLEWIHQTLWSPLHIRFSKWAEWNCAIANYVDLILHDISLNTDTVILAPHAK